MSRSSFKYFAIFAAMRTGSNLLERNLNQFNGIVCHGELFNPAFVGKSEQTEFMGIDLVEREADPDKLIARIIEKSGDMLPGFRIFQGHDHRVFKTALADPDCAKIILRRRPIDSFVSLEIAKATDQWILGNAPKRKTAQVHYDGAAYRDYLRALGGYEAELRQRLQEAGQTAFELRYEDLKTPAVLNGLVSYLGRGDRRNHFEESIRRQNPEPLSEKVSNYAEMIADLGGLDAETLDGQVGPETTRGIGIRDLVVSNVAPVLYAPLPGVSSQKVYALMARLGGGKPVELGSDLSQKELAAWLDEAGARLQSFTLIEHPLERAYGVFMSHIFPPVDATYPKIRRRLKAQFDVPLPEKGDDLSDWTTDRHRAAFEGFLVFLKSNLAGQTSIRIDGRWEAQHKLLGSVQVAQPIARIVKSGAFAEFAAELEGVGAYSVPDPPDQAPSSLAEIYNRRLENLARAAYAKDYRLFGFGAWRPS